MRSRGPVTSGKWFSILNRMARRATRALSTELLVLRGISCRIEDHDHQPSAETTFFSHLGTRHARRSLPGRLTRNPKRFVS